MGLTKTAMLKAIQLAKTRQLPGFEDLPLRDQMRSATFAKEDLVRQLAETLKLDAADVAQLVQNAPAGMDAENDVSVDVVVGFDCSW